MLIALAVLVTIGAFFLGITVSENYALNQDYEPRN